MIHARGLARSFRTRRGTVDAVSGVDIDVSAGELVGFLGPNGAGKSTTLRMLTTLIHPTAGTATVAGHDLLTEPVAVRRKIGYVGQNGGAGPDCRVGEELVLQGRLYGLSAVDAARRAGELVRDLDLTGLETRVVSTLSGGQRRRLDIAMGLMHLPTLLFLDEPSTGLDPQSRANLWGHIRGLHAEHGTTLFLTTHYLDEADALCDRILVIDQGRIVAEGTPDALKRRVSGDLVLVGTTDPSRTAQLVERLGTELTIDGPSVRFRVDDGASVLPGLLRELDAAGITMTSVEVRRPSLDDVFLTLTGRSLREDAPNPEPAEIPS
ncbi:ATP-binding cassette domain-containing protein [Pseudonocardia sp. KRD-184]|uniref:ATP-binding cassette domain-containing protein n=1 Tax=Pseudonocardia oceani TaxID=2792013 RepID=A0ABS6UBI2_9PSEU|nr:ATP-binding cassette domain-containing protein [Pseudonocardia oceani]MBW0091124.1 ATP-binding cassette domain-containing protein [Pseudonocardia oceani]MBW0098222.1 ATP-binding cassette domain-containing protein [Pseudonocardia oceani]MBW0110793.1 ATP-binding cassette domain-containing protein [Pseudonocardia oceani]MBW0124828.1 ATP-binding cassette domain-containing protein [Pseudonocardia oceani]MBW0129601.1 ATP-binding cassette domain-containing protein [Pseudonocardia oceani]